MRCRPRSAPCGARARACRRCSAARSTSGIAEGAPVPRDGTTMGEVVLRGNTVMAGYLDDAGGHVRGLPRRLVPLGDAAVVHADGRIELRDRFKDVIVSGGENISTIEVEQALARHPAVLDCAVVGVPARPLGRASQGVRRAAARRRGDGRGADGVLPRAARGLQVPGQRRIRRACRAPRRARCRSSCCASANGRAASAASTDA